MELKLVKKKTLYKEKHNHDILLQIELPLANTPIQTPMVYF